MDIVAVLQGVSAVVYCAVYFVERRKGGQHVLPPIVYLVVSAFSAAALVLRLATG